jgi:DNA repair exonuclease SbcCD ATPase subunit
MISSKIQEAKTLREEAKKESAEAGTLEGRIVESDKTTKKIGEKIADHKEKQQLVNRLELIDSYLGLDGIRMQIIEKYLPVLNDYIAGFLELTSKGRMEVVVAADKKKEGKIEMTVTGSSAPAPELVSGGEFVALRLAVDLGLGMLSMLRNDNAPDFVCLDEVFAPVDAAGKWRMFEVVNKLQEHFRTVIVISHDAFIREKIKNTIMVHKINDISTIEKQVFDPTLFKSA